MAGGLNIPEYQPLDFSGIAQIPQLYLAARKAASDEEVKRAQAEVQRMYAENEAQKIGISRESAQMAREKHQQEMQDRREKKAADDADFLQGLKDSGEFNTPLGQARARARGIEIGETPQETAPAPHVNAPGVMEQMFAPAKAGLPNVGAPREQGAPAEWNPEQEQVNQQPMPVQAAAAAAGAPEPTPTQAATQEWDPEVENPVGPPAAPPPDEAGAPSPAAAEMERISQPLPVLAARKYYAQLNGQRVDLGEGQGVQPHGLDADEQAVYDLILKTSHSPEQAAQAAVKFKTGDAKAQNAMMKFLIAEAGRNNRAGEFHQDVPTQIAEHDKSLAAAQRRAETAAAAKRDTNPVDVKMMTRLQQQTKLWQSTTDFQKLSRSNQLAEQLKLNLDSAIPLGHADAKVLMARIFRGGVPPKHEMETLYSNLGGWVDKLNQLKAKLTKGDASPAQLRQMREIRGLITKEIELNKQAAVASGREFLGPKAGFDAMPDQATQNFRGALRQLHMDPDTMPPLFEDVEGGVTLGEPGGTPHVRHKAAPKAGGPAPAAGGAESDADFLKRWNIH